MIVKNLLIPIIIVFMFGAGAAALMATAPQLDPEPVVPELLTVQVQEVLPENVRLNVNSQGTVQPSVETQLIPEVSGKIEWTSEGLVTGGYFEQGDELARIETIDYETALERAEAAQLRAEAEYQHASFELKRVQSLEERKLVSRSNLENAIRIYKINQAALKDARANQKQAEKNLKRTTLRAPFTGLVRSESVDIGQFVSRGQPIGTIYASDIVEIRLPIADNQLAFLEIAPTTRGEIPKDLQPIVTLEANYAGRSLSWQGKIVRSEAEIDSSSRMVQLVARVDNSLNEIPLSVGLFVNAKILGREARDVFSLPRSALRSSGEVIVVDEENRLRYRKVEPLRLYKDTVLLSYGLSAGERVCLAARKNLIEGTRVNTITQQGSASSNQPVYLGGAQ